MTTVSLAVAWLVGCRPGTGDKGATTSSDGSGPSADTGDTTDGSTPDPTATSATTADTAGTPGTTATGPSICGPSYGSQTRYAVGGGIGNSSLYRIHLDGEIDEWVADLKYLGQDLVADDLLVEGNTLVAVAGGRALRGTLPPVGGTVDLEATIAPDPQPPEFLAVAGAPTVFYGIEDDGRGVWYVNLGSPSATRVGIVPLPADCSEAFDFLDDPSVYGITQFVLALHCTVDPINRQYLVDLSIPTSPTATFLGGLDGDEWLVATTTGAVLEENHLWVGGQERQLAWCVSPTVTAPISLRGAAR